MIEILKVIKNVGLEKLRPLFAFIMNIKCDNINLSIKSEIKYIVLDKLRLQNLIYKLSKPSEISKTYRNTAAILLHVTKIVTGDIMV